MDAAVLSEKVLVLNRSWVAVNVATVRRALLLVIQDAARIVSPEDYSTYDFEGWVEASQAAKEGRRIHSASFSFRVPEVIVLTVFNGRFSKEVRFSRRNIFERDENTCQYCGRKFDRGELTLDHVTPRSRGGTSTWANIVLACLKCNMRKGSHLPNELGMRLLRKPVKPQWATRVGVKIGRVLKPSWERFLEEAYWEVELRE
ncbi:MAG TPA: HNH endonuclease [Planctomycetota bacterium]|jgi:5-methylcytosine-specific restriction endonuclease McrA